MIQFCVEAPEGALTREGDTALANLQRILLTRNNWISRGRADDSRCPGISNNVSNTVVVRPEEWDQVQEFIWQNRGFLGGVTVLGYISDKEIPNMPREEVTTEADKLRWEMIRANEQPVDYSQMTEDTDTTKLAGEVACAGGSCLLE